MITSISNRKFVSAFIYIWFIPYFFSSEGDAIKCYECNSYNETECARDPPPPELERNCTALDTNTTKYILCRKIVQSIWADIDGLPANTRVIRSCGWDADRYLDRCYTKGGFKFSQYVCSCTTDLCNAAGAPSSALAALTGALGLLLTSHAL